MTNNLNIFFRETLEELKKISWPTKKEFIIGFFGTLFIIFLFSLYLGAVDTLIGFIITKIIYSSLQ